MSEIIRKEDIVYSDLEKLELDGIMKEAYLDYSLSVIIGRALPDVRDGLKPVHRRIIHAMNVLKITHGGKYKKSARIVGDVIGKYHPHGDTSVYDALVRMAQDFSLKYPLIDGQGNFGSIDGDNAAAMRYTESRISKLTSFLLKDIEKNTIDIIDNYDGTETEPVVLPTMVPNLLLNGSSGIAVGMATNIPPHNLNELIDGSIYLLNNQNAEIKDLFQFIKGPDLPTGGTIMGTQGIQEAYETGYGKFKIRAVSVIEEKNNREKIIITEIPYQVNKANLVIKIDELVKNKEIDGISEITDESSREGIRIVIKIKKDSIGEIVLNNLYKKTNLQITFGITLLAVENKRPKVFNLKELLNIFLNHRKSVIIRRTIFDLNKIKIELEKLSGFIIANQNIDRIIQIIKTAENVEKAKEIMKLEFNLTDLQTDSIIQMRLSKLNSIEIDKVEKEIIELNITLKELELVLSSNEELNRIITEELLIVKNNFSDKRKSNIEDNFEDYDVKDLIPNIEMVVSLTNNGYIKRVALENYNIQNRGGKGKTAVTTYEDDEIKNFFTCKTHDDLIFITDKGNLFKLPVYKIPEANRLSKGKSIINLINLDKDENIVSSLFKNTNNLDYNLMFLTKKGLIKQTKIEEFKNVKNKGIKAIKLDEGDELIDTVIVTPNDKEVLLATKMGISIKFPLSGLKVIGRNTKGVTGIKFKYDNDEVVGMALFENQDEEILTLTENGIGKVSSISEYRLQKRAGKGVFAMKVNEKTGNIIGILKLSKENDKQNDILIVSSEGKILRVDLNLINTTKRTTQGVKLIDLPDNEVVLKLTESNIEDEVKDNDIIEEK